MIKEKIVTFVSKNGQEKIVTFVTKNHHGLDGGNIYSSHLTPEGMYSSKN